MKPFRCQNVLNGFRCVKNFGHNGPCASLYGRNMSLTTVTFDSAPLEEFKYLDEQWNSMCAPDLKPEKIFAWRMWRISRNGLLKSLTADYIWNSRICTVREGARPVPGNPHRTPMFALGDTRWDWGVYVYKTPALMYRYLVGEIYPATRLVIGLVRCLGSGVEHEYGYRFEAVKMEHLSVIHNNDLDDATLEFYTKHLSTFYDVPVRDLKRDKLKSWCSYYSEPNSWREFLPNEKEN